MSKTEAYRAALLIIEDACDRSGLDHIFDGMDEETHDEIVESWGAIIQGVFDAESASLRQGVERLRGALSVVAEINFTYTRRGLSPGFVTQGEWSQVSEAADAALRETEGLVKP